LVANPVSRNQLPATRKTSLDKKREVGYEDEEEEEEDRLESAGELIRNPIAACLASENATGCDCTGRQTECLSSLFPTEPIKDTDVWPNPSRNKNHPVA
jgi:hypothetical protein